MQKDLFYLSLSIVMLLFGGCQERRGASYDAAVLIKNKCASCHNLEMPPHTSADEKAPPMMAVTFHIRDFMKVSDPSQKRQKFINFVTDYVLDPAASKSFCDKKSLQAYGLMPSQKGKVSKGELKAIAAYMYDHYDPNRFMQMMVERSRLAAMPVYKRVLESKNCLGCHGIQQRKIAPSLKEIAQKRDLRTIEASIKHGSRGRWEGFKLSMPPFKDLNESDLQAVAVWIESLAR